MLKYQLKFELASQSLSQKRESVISSIVDESDPPINNIIESEIPIRSPKVNDIIKVDGDSYVVSKITHEYTFDVDVTYDTMVLLLDDSEKKQKELLNARMIEYAAKAQAVSSQATIEAQSRMATYDMMTKIISSLPHINIDETNDKKKETNTIL